MSKETIREDVLNPYFLEVYSVADLHDITEEDKAKLREYFTEVKRVRPAIVIQSNDFRNKETGEPLLKALSEFLDIDGLGYADESITDVIEKIRS